MKDSDRATRNLVAFVFGVLLMITVIAPAFIYFSI